MERTNRRRGSEMTGRRLIGAVIVALLALPGAEAVAGGRKVEQGPRCGSRFVDADRCSFRYRGGQLYLGGYVSGGAAGTGGVVIRLEARIHSTQQRKILLACATAANGACSAGGRLDVERLRKGQRLFCVVEGAGRGEYECGTLVRRW
jgi:hypothetical protein